MPCFGDDLIDCCPGVDAIVTEHDVIQCGCLPITESKEEQESLIATQLAITACLCATIDCACPLADEDFIERDTAHSLFHAEKRVGVDRLIRAVPIPPCFLRDDGADNNLLGVPDLPHPAWIGL